MTRKQTSSSRDGGEANATQDQAVLTELRRINRLLASFTTRGMDRSESIPFLDAAGYSSTQIGEILGVNPITVRTTLHRARLAKADDMTAKTNSQEAVSQGQGSTDNVTD